MSERRRHSSHAWLYALVDVQFVVIFVLFAYVLLVMTQINDAKTPPPIKQPGDIAVLACWDEGNNDVDLWADGPGQTRPTGYSTKSGEVWSLLRDDLGLSADPYPLNCENMFARATPPGEYVINLHGYSLPGGQVTVHVEISINGKLFMMENKVLLQKQEVTLIRFTLDSAANVKSTNIVFKKLRSSIK